MPLSSNHRFTDTFRISWLYSVAMRGFYRKLDRALLVVKQARIGPANDDMSAYDANFSTA